MSSSKSINVFGGPRRDEVLVRSGNEAWTVTVPGGASLVQSLLVAAGIVRRNACLREFAETNSSLRITLEPEEEPKAFFPKTREVVFYAHSRARAHGKGTTGADLRIAVLGSDVVPLERAANTEIESRCAKALNAFLASNRNVPLILASGLVPRVESGANPLAKLVTSKPFEVSRRKVLLTYAQALRNAGYRMREDGSTSAAVEDACAIVGHTADGSNPNLSATEAIAARSFFAQFDDVIIRIRADALLHFSLIRKGRNGIRHGGKDETSPFIAKLHYACDGDRLAWLRHRDAVFGLDAIVVAVVAKCVVGSRSGRISDSALAESIQRILSLVRRGYATCGEPKLEGIGGPIAQWRNPAFDFGQWLWERSRPGEDDRVFVRVLDVDAVRTSPRGRWDLFEVSRTEGQAQPVDQQFWLQEAMEIADKGLEPVNREESEQKFRVFKMGELRSVDREEIDGLTSLWRLMRTYLTTYLDNAKRPLSVGVFGAPGSGKSFGIKEVAAHVRSLGTGGSKRKDGTKDEPLEFNVSQFASLNDLVVALQMVRDRFLATGRVPVAIFDEFDVNFDDKPFGWLQYFLMPMQDGKFKHEGQIFQTGSAIFIFCGGTNHSFNEFSSRQRDQEFCAAKGPDFISRLRGIHNVPSLDKPRDPQPAMVPRWMIRRAGLLHFYLQDRKACIRDGSLLRAFLTVPFYRHGARSLEALVEMCARQRSGVIDRTSLPRRDQLELHTDAAAFWNIICER